MLTTLATLKARLAIPTEETANDILLTNALKAISARFDKETSRTLARTENFTQEFDSATTEVLAACYPVESVQKFETKTSEASGWQEVQPTPDFLIRSSCIISLPSPPFVFSAFQPFLSRVTYTGGYLLPGSPPPAPPVAACLPDDLEQAAVEQTAYWFQNREHLGLKTYWPSGVAYYQFAALDLLASVQSTLKQYQRWSISA